MSISSASRQRRPSAAAIFWYLGRVQAARGASWFLRRERNRLARAILLFTIDPQSPIGLLADDVVQIWAPSHKALVQVEGDTSGQPQGSLFEQSLLILLDAIVVALMTSSNMTSEDLFSRHANLE